jgi:hypothetical protein
MRRDLFKRRDPGLQRIDFGWSGLDELPSGYPIEIRVVSPMPLIFFTTLPNRDFWCAIQGWLSVVPDNGSRLPVMVITDSRDRDHARRRLTDVLMMCWNRILVKRWRPGLRTPGIAG